MKVSVRTQARATKVAQQTGAFTGILVQNAVLTTFDICINLWNAGESTYEQMKKANKDLNKKK